MNPTRGNGNLEIFLAKWRMQKALEKIKQGREEGALLDIGCGTYPLFLIQAPFKKKIGIEQIPPPELPAGIEICSMTLNENLQLPFSNQSFDCVSALALLEHLDPKILPTLLLEINRVLKSSGQFIATTPHAYADKVLRGLAKIGMVSKEEIDEHKSRFKKSNLLILLTNSGFIKEKIEIQGFQWGMNILISAEK